MVTTGSKHHCGCCKAYQYCKRSNPIAFKRCTKFIGKNNVKKVKHGN
jgi:hypothetical protein